ncbi:MAG: hypothetical protein U0802_15735 [Candidatus Binatia bacterium]
MRPTWRELESLRATTLPRALAAEYELPRDRHREQALDGEVGWLATGDLLDVLGGACAALEIVPARRRSHHRRRRGGRVARVADDPPQPPARPAAGLHERSRILALVPHFRLRDVVGDRAGEPRGAGRPPDAVVVIDDSSPEPPADVVERFAGCTLLAAEGIMGPMASFSR